MNKKILGIIIIFVIVLVFLLSIFLKKEDSTNFKIYFFNAGKADAILIMNNDHYIMIDTGEEELTSEILNYFRNNNINKLDYLIITHFDKDHVGSAANIINNIEVSNVLQSNYIKDSEYYQNYIKALEDNSISAMTIQNDFEINIGNMNIIVNGPNTIYDNNESNNSSLIVSLTYDNTKYLFMGDSQNARIKDYLDTHNETYDFIKIPYHGNYLKRLEELLEVVKPKYAVITASKTEGAEEDTINLLEQLDIDYYITSNGDITIKVDNNKNIKIYQ